MKNEDYYTENLIKRYKKHTEFEELPDQVQKDLREWFNCEPDEDEKEDLLVLYIEGRFKAWDCPECGTRCLIAAPDSWYNYQGVQQNDYTSYPGSKKYRCEYNEQLCDDCRSAPDKL